MGQITEIQGVLLTPLKQIFHPAGNVLHGIKKSDSGFSGFGEAYFSTIKQGVIKPWKKHMKMTLNIIVPVGEIRFVLFDDRKNSYSKGKYMDIKLSLKNYNRLTIPPNVWVAFQGVEPTNLLLNIANIEHDPQEVVRTDLDKINFDW